MASGVAEAKAVTVTTEIVVSMRNGTYGGRFG
jgi:hypothetical protein